MIATLNIPAMVAQLNKGFPLSLTQSAMLLDRVVKLERENGELARDNDVLRSALESERVKLEEVGA